MSGRIRFVVTGLDEMIDAMDALTKPPTPATIAELDSVLEEGFAMTQGQVHVISEELKLSGAGIRVDSERPDLLVDAALELRNDARRAARMGESGRAFQNSHLGADALLGAFHRLLSTVAAGRQLSESGELNPKTVP